MLPYPHVRVELAIKGNCMTFLYLEYAIFFSAVWLIDEQFFVVVDV